MSRQGCFDSSGRDAMEVAREIVETVTDPSAMIGPEVLNGVPY